MFVVAHRKHRMSMPLVVQPTWEFVSIPHSLTLLSASIYGKYIGFKGEKQMNFLLYLFSFVNSFFLLKCLLGLGLIPAIFFVPIDYLCFSLKIFLCFGFVEHLSV